MLQMNVEPFGPWDHIATLEKAINFFTPIAEDIAHGRVEDTPHARQLHLRTAMDGLRSVKMPKETNTRPSGNADAQPPLEPKTPAEAAGAQPAEGTLPALEMNVADSDNEASDAETWMIGDSCSEDDYNSAVAFLANDH